MSERKAKDRSPETGPYKIGYIVRYDDETDDNEYHRQVKAVKATRPKYILQDRDVRGQRGKKEPAKRTGLKLLMRGLLPGDIVVMSSLDRLGTTPRQMADALLMLGRNEIRLLDVDPDGDREWRPAVEYALSLLVKRRIDRQEHCDRVIPGLRDGTLFRGIGWRAKSRKGSVPNMFEPYEGPREVCRAIVRMRDGGMEFADISDKLNTEGVLYVGVRVDLNEPFTPQLAEECYLSAKQDFPYPTPAIQV